MEKIQGFPMVKVKEYMNHIPRNKKVNPENVNLLLGDIQRKKSCKSWSILIDYYYYHQIFFKKWRIFQISSKFGEKSANFWPFLRSQLAWSINKGNCTLFWHDLKEALFLRVYSKETVLIKKEFFFFVDFKKDWD